jgi:hypothetical protein
MRNLLLALIGVLWFAGGGQAFAQSGGLLEAWRLSDMRSVMQAVGATYEGTGEAESGTTYVTGRSLDGINFIVFGTECTGYGDRQMCTGAEMVAEFRMNSDAAVQQAVRDLDYAAVRISHADRNVLRVTRYVIFDYGITRANLQTNLEVFLYISNEVSRRIYR